MNQAETQIFLTGCDHILTLTLAQLRIAVAHVTPVAQSLEEGSKNREYLDSGLGHLHQLHGYLLDQLSRLSALSAQMGNAVMAPGAGVSSEGANPSPGSEAGNTPFNVH